MGKRANGQGAVYLRWEGQLRLPAGGRKSVYARTRRDLLRKLRGPGGCSPKGASQFANPDPQHIPRLLAGGRPPPGPALDVPQLRAGG